MCLFVFQDEHFGHFFGAPMDKSMGYGDYIIRLDIFHAWAGIAMITICPICHDVCSDAFSYVIYSELLVRAFWTCCSKSWMKPGFSQCWKLLSKFVPIIDPIYHKHGTIYFSWKTVNIGTLDMLLPILDETRILPMLENTAVGANWFTVSKSN